MLTKRANKQALLQSAGILHTDQRHTGPCYYPHHHQSWGTEDIRHNGLVFPLAWVKDKNSPTEKAWITLTEIQTLINRQRGGEKGILICYSWKSLTSSRENKLINPQRPSWVTLYFKDPNLKLVFSLLKGGLWTYSIWSDHITCCQPIREHNYGAVR